MYKSIEQITSYIFLSKTNHIKIVFVFSILSVNVFLKLYHIEFFLTSKNVLFLSFLGPRKLLYFYNIRQGALHHSL